MRPKFLLFSAILINQTLASGCGAGSRSASQKEIRTNETSNPGKSSDALAEVTQTEETPTKINLNLVRSEGTSFDTLAIVDYQNADFAQVIRCSSHFTLRSASGIPARNSDGQMISLSQIESRAIWESALSDTSHCRLLGEKLVRVSFSDPFAATGSYFYIFNPCRSAGSSESYPTGMACSFQLSSTDDISLRNTVTEEKLRLLQLMLNKEGALAAVTLRFRNDLTIALEAQKRCEGNAAVDAVKEARTKALATLLGTGIAAAIGGVVAGPGGAVAIAQQTLQWIAQYYGPGTQANPSKCVVLRNAENEAQNSASELEKLRNEISQIQEDLAHL